MQGTSGFGKYWEIVEVSNSHLCDDIEDENGVIEAECSGEGDDGGRVFVGIVFSRDHTLDSVPERHARDQDHVGQNVAVLCNKN